MGLTKEQVRSIARKGVFIFVIAFVLWLFSHQRYGENRHYPHTDTLWVAVDLVPGSSFGIDSVGNVSGVYPKLLQLMLPNDSIVEWVPFTDREDALKALRQHRVALYATTYPFSNRDDLREVLSTEWLYHSSYSLLLNKERIWVEDFSDDVPTKVYVSKNDPGALLLLENLKELAYPSLEIVESNYTSTQLSVMLVNGEIDYLMCMSNFAHAVAEVDSRLSAADDLSFDTRQVWLVSAEEKQLKSKLDSSILMNRTTEAWHMALENDY